MTESISLQKRLSWYMISTLLVLTLLSGTGVYLGTTHEAEEMFGASLVQTARILDGVITREQILNNKQKLERVLEIPSMARNEQNITGHKYENKLFLSVLDMDGTVLLSSPHAPAIEKIPQTPGFGEMVIDDNTWNTFTLNSSDDGLQIIVGERNDINKEMVEYILQGLLWPLVLLLPVILWFLLNLVKVVLMPLQLVSDEVNKQDIRHLKTINVHGVPQEIDPLVNSLNHMIQNLDDAYNRERRFVSDASHELRNPLAALLINVENAIEENTDDELGDSLNSMRESIIRLTHLVSQLLELSHLENPLSLRNLEPIDLSLICKQAADSFQKKASNKQQELKLEIDGSSFQIMGSTVLLQSLVNNLLDNAIKYCGEKAVIRLSCKQQQDKLKLCIDDSGPGLDAELRKNIVQRFFRAEQTNAEGAGLGLSIVKSIAETHSATMQILESELGGLSVQIEFKNNC